MANSVWDDAPRFGDETTSRRKHRPGAYAVIGDSLGRIAVVRASDGMFLPGGGIEPGESPEAALVREALEECGWTIRVLSRIAVAIQFTPAFEKPSSFFAIEILSSAGQGTEPGHKTLWRSPDAAVRELMHQSHAWAVRQFTAAVAGAPPARRIVAFHQDNQGHWVADLECGHGQHVRHDPPWQVRPWVLSPEGRTSKVGVELLCPLCAAARRT